jgi:hypothetical protein
VRSSQDHYPLEAFSPWGKTPLSARTQDTSGTSPEPASVRFVPCAEVLSFYRAGKTGLVALGGRTHYGERKQPCPNQAGTHQYPNEASL